MEFGVSQHLLKQGNGLINLPELCFCLLELRTEEGVVGEEAQAQERRTPNAHKSRRIRVGKMGEDHGQGVAGGPVCLAGLSSP